MLDVYVVLIKIGSVCRKSATLVLVQFYFMVEMLQAIRTAFLCLARTFPARSQLHVLSEK